MLLFMCTTVQYLLWTNEIISSRKARPVKEKKKAKEKQVSCYINTTNTINKKKNLCPHHRH